MCKVLSISGSHGVGKTSLVDLIMNDSLSLPYNIKIFKEFNSGLYRIGFSLNGQAHDFDEVMFSQKKAFYLLYDTIKYYLGRINDNRLIVIDRSCIDTYVYTCFFLQQYKTTNNLSQYKNLLADMETKSKEILLSINHILLPPFSNFDICDDRMTLIERDKIWDLFSQFCSNNKSDKIHILSSNNSSDRYKEVKNIILSL